MATIAGRHCQTSLNHELHHSYSYGHKTEPKLRLEILESIPHLQGMNRLTKQITHASSPLLDAWETFGLVVMSFISAWFMTIAVSMAIFAYRFISWVLTW
jgi:hypothetical protein